MNNDVMNSHLVEPESDRLIRFIIHMRVSLWQVTLAFLENKLSFNLSQSGSLLFIIMWPFGNRL